VDDSSAWLGVVAIVVVVSPCGDLRDLMTCTGDEPPAKRPKIFAGTGDAPSQEDEEHALEFQTGRTYESPLKYVVLPQTGLQLRKEADLRSEPAGRLECGAAVEVSERRFEPSQVRGRRVMRVRISSPVHGWTSELPKFLALAVNQEAPLLCSAAPSEEPSRREAAAFNGRGEDLRIRLCRDCLDCVILRTSLDVERMRKELEVAEREHSFLEKPAVLVETMQGKTQGWSSIPLRSVGGATGDEGNILSFMQNEAEFADTPVMKHCPYIRQIISEIETAKVFRVRLMKLKAGGVIAPHHDFFESHKVVRLHLPIVTNKQVEFFIRGKAHTLEPGMLYFTNVRQEHEGANRSNSDRVHLVIDVEASLSLQDQIWDSLSNISAAAADV
ncbi:unnamed protein product, partial [Polarella glacialis]